MILPYNLFLASINRRVSSLVQAAHPSKGSKQLIPTKDLQMRRKSDELSSGESYDMTEIAAYAHPTRSL